jgi:hypothetical protein
MKKYHYDVSKLNFVTTAVIKHESWASKNI